jgi:menaquinone-dependent protoporphyrinogen oxidase
MSVLIVYRSKYGFTAGCCRALARLIASESTVADLASRGVPDPREFDIVLVGGSIYGGKMQREVVSFCDRHAPVLGERRVGLFISCLYEGEHAQAQLRAAFPDWLTGHAFAAGLFGGEIRYRELTFLDRLLVRSVSPLSTDVSHPKPEAMQAMADAVNALPRLR